MTETRESFDLPPRAAIGLTLLFVIAGLVLRLLFRFQFAASDVSVLLWSETMDSFAYHEWACRIVNGDLTLGRSLFTLSPFYSYLLAPIYAVSGCEMAAALFVQLLLGGVAILFLSLAGSAIFGRLAGIVAAGLAAFYGPFVLTEGLLLSESFLPFLTAVFLWWTARALGRERPGLFLISGLLLGVLFSIRPQYFLCVLLLPLFGLGAAWLRDRRDRAAGARRAMIAIILFGAAGAALAVAPLGLRNLVVAKKPVLLTAAGGVNFHIGNGPEATGTWRIPEGFRTTQRGMFEDFAGAAGEISADATSRYWFDRTCASIADDPGRWARIMTKKAWLFWNDLEVPVNFDLSIIRERIGAARIACVPFWIAGTLGLLGLALALVRRRAGWLVLMTLAYFLGTILFFVAARYRIAVVPALLLFAGYAVESVLLLFRHRRWPALAGCALLLGLAFLLTTRETAFSVRAEDRASLYRYMAVHFAQEGELGKAEKWIGEAMGEDPANPVLDGDLGMILLRAGRLDEAEKVLRRAIKALPDHPDVDRLREMLEIIPRLKRQRERWKRPRERFPEEGEDPDWLERELRMPRDHRQIAPDG